jgi:hypothetical protein
MTKVSSMTKESLKALVLLVLGILLLISLVFLTYKSLSKKEKAFLPVKSSNPYEVKLAEETLNSMLVKDIYGFVKEHREKERYLEIMVDSSSWNRFSIKEKKAFLNDISRARIILGMRPDVKILDSATRIELASFEHGRAALAGYDD